MKRISLLFVLVLALFMPAQYAFAQNVNYDIDELSRAAVQVLVEDGTGSGTLIVLHNKALVVTNRHVVENFDEANIGVLVDVTETAQPLFRAELRGFSLEYDFAYLELTHELNTDDLEADVSTLEPFSIRKLRSGDYGFDLPTIILNPNTELGRGADIAIFGYPGIGDNELVYTTGNIASLQYGELNGMRLPMWYRTSAEMSSGNSGGLSVDSEGNFIGIPTSVTQEYETGGRLGNLLALPFALALMNDDEQMETDWAIYREVNELELDPTMEAAFGASQLSAAQIASSFTVELTSGGTANANYLGEGCVGYAAQAPDYSVTLTEPVQNLMVSFTSVGNDGSNADPTMIVQSPDGTWHCNDDHEGLDPAVMLSTADAGKYSIWVGSYSDGDFYSGRLSFNNNGQAHNGGMPIPGATRTSLDFTAEPNFETVQLAAGFLPDPHAIPVIAGGAVDINAQNIGNCYGFASSAPDVRLIWSSHGTASDLLLSFLANNQGDDTVMVVNTPSGSWLCDDDLNGLNPGLSIDNAADGQYDIWIGSYSGENYPEGRFAISETNSTLEPEGIDPTASFDLSAEPHFATVTLEQGFQPSTHRVAVTAGGSVDVNAQNIGRCYGYAASAPDVRLHWTGASELMLSFVASAQGDDTVIVVNDPNGNWHCNDDMEGLNPGLNFQNAPTGQYDIWIGSYGSGNYHDGELLIRDGSPAAVNSKAALMNSVAPQLSVQDTYNDLAGSGPAAITLEPGFLPDPNTTERTASGVVDLSTQNIGDCRGYVMSTPDAYLNWSGSGYPLYFAFEAGAGGGDAVMVINDGNGNWYCNDDAGGTLNPGISFKSAPSGVYQIWTGTFSQSANVSGTLKISEMNLF